MYSADRIYEQDCVVQKMMLNVDEVQQTLCTKRFGREILFFHEITSTNDRAKDLARYGASEGTVLITEVQTAGRGRSGKEWISPSGGLWFSVIVRPKAAATETAGLLFVPSVAVVEVLNETYKLQAETKWPNDVLVHGKKICGVLVETNITGIKVKFALLGIGLNANLDPEKSLPEKLRSVSTSLQNELNCGVQLEDLLRRLLEKMEITYDGFLARGSNSIVEQWKKYTSFLGKDAQVLDGNTVMSGVAENVDKDGALILRLADGTTQRVYGDATFRTN